MYHGWNDQLVAPMNSVNYYQAVVGATKSSADSIRLFMMPGMTHCRGGAGPDSFDRMGVIERWVEKGEAPKQIVAEHLTGAASIADARSARIRRSPPTQARAASMQPTPSCARSRNRSLEST